MITISDSEIAQIVRIADNPAHLNSDDSLPAYFAKQVKRLVNRLRVAERATELTSDYSDHGTDLSGEAEEELKAEGKLIDV